MWQPLIVIFFIPIIVQGNNDDNNISNDQFLNVLSDHFAHERNDVVVTFQPPKIVNIPTPISVVPPRVWTYEEYVKETQEKVRKQNELVFRNYGTHVAIAAAATTFVGLIITVLVMLRKYRQRNNMTRLITET